MKKIIVIVHVVLILPMVMGQESTSRGVDLSSYSQQEVMDMFSPLGTEDVNNIDGEIVYLYGKVALQDGTAAVGYKVEIWQTDKKGVYDYPRSFNTKNRDRNFQFYGSVRTDSQGRYSFRTIMPGEYEPRPRHIHFKVKDSNEKTVLISQFYFRPDVAKVERESMVRTIGKNVELILLELEKDSSNYFAVGNIIIKGGTSTKLQRTPSQSEGPYYPRKNLDLYDNDLVRIN